MLIDPASKVSVPFAVVMRTRSRVPERVLEPAPFHVLPSTVDPSTQLQHQVFDPNKDKIYCPEDVVVAV